MSLLLSYLRMCNTRTTSSSFSFSRQLPFGLHHLRVPLVSLRRFGNHPHHRGFHSLSRLVPSSSSSMTSRPSIMASIMPSNRLILQCSSGSGSGSSGNLFRGFRMGRLSHRGAAAAPAAAAAANPADLPSAGAELLLWLAGHGRGGGVTRSSREHDEEEDLAARLAPTLEALAAAARDCSSSSRGLDSLSSAPVVDSLPQAASVLAAAAVPAEMAAEDVVDAAEDNDDVLPTSIEYESRVWHVDDLHKLQRMSLAKMLRERGDLQRCLPLRRQEFVGMLPKELLIGAVLAGFDRAAYKACQRELKRNAAWRKQAQRAAHFTDESYGTMYAFRDPHTRSMFKVGRTTNIGVRGSQLRKCYGGDVEMKIKYRVPAVVEVEAMVHEHLSGSGWARHAAVRCPGCGQVHVEWFCAAGSPAAAGSGGSSSSASAKAGGGGSGGVRQQRQQLQKLAQQQQRQPRRSSADASAAAQVDPICLESFAAATAAAADAGAEPPLRFGVGASALAAASASAAVEAGAGGGGGSAGQQQQHQQKQQRLALSDVHRVVLFNAFHAALQRYRHVMGMKPPPVGPKLG